MGKATSSACTPCKECSAACDAAANIPGSSEHEPALPWIMTPAEVVLYGNLHTSGSCRTFHQKCVCNVHAGSTADPALESGNK